MWFDSRSPARLAFPWPSGGLLGLLLLLAAPAAQAQDIIHVVPEGSASSYGDTWANATTLKQALSIADQTDEIWVAEGAYEAARDNDPLDMYLDNGDDVSVYGGFAGGEASRGERDPAMHAVTIRSVLKMNTRSGDTTRVLIDGVTFTGEGLEALTAAANHHLRINNVTFDETAGALDFESLADEALGTLTVTNAVFSGNKTSGDGGAINMYSEKAFGDTRGGATDLQVVNTVFKNNQAGGDGGAISYEPVGGSGRPAIINSTFFGNDAFEGGAVSIKETNDPNEAAVSVANSIFYGNTGGQGPAIQKRTDAALPLRVRSTLIDGGLGGPKVAGEGIVDEGGNLAVAPRFVGSEIGDLRLAEGSPAIDAGEAALLDLDNDGTRDITTDAGGEARVQNGVVDLGAYEGGVVTADLRLSVFAPQVLAEFGAERTIYVALVHESASDASNVAVEVRLPPGLPYVRDDAGGAYDPATGTWTVGALAGGTSDTLAITVQNTVSEGALAMVEGEVVSSTPFDYDSTPDNGANGEDDYDEQRAATGALAATDSLHEDKVGVEWASVPERDVRLRLERNGQLLSYLARDRTAYVDDAGMPNTDYEYCIVLEDGFETQAVWGCDTGQRTFRAPEAVAATDGRFTDRVVLSWADRSEIETGYRVYRDGGRIAALGANTARYVDTSATSSPSAPDQYCVVPVENGDEGRRICDDGYVGDLLPATGVTASNGVYPDRVRLTWADQDTTDVRFALSRDGTPLDTIDVTYAAGAAAPQANLAYGDTGGTSGKTHEYCVTRLDGSASSVPACDDGGYGTLPEPGTVRASDGAFDDRVELSWRDDAEVEDGYRVLRNRIEGAVDTLGTVGPDVVSYTDTSAVPGVQYRYCIVTFTEEGAAATGCTRGRRSAVTEPLAVAATDSTHEDKVVVTWGSESTRAQLFNLYRNGAPLTTISGASDLRYVDEEVAPGVEYEYCVASFTNDGEESGRACDDGSRALNAPQNVQATDDEYENRVQVSWQDDSAIETGFRVYRRRVAPLAPDSTLIAETVRNETLALDTTVASGVQYRYSVRAVDERDDLDPVYHGVSGVRSDAGRRTLAAPTLVEAADGASETQTLVQWEDNSSAERGYRIRRIAGSDTTLTGTTLPNVTSFADTSGGLGVAYRYTVAAYDAHGESATGADKGRTLVRAPGSASASTSYTVQVRVKWVDRSERESGYAIYRDGNYVGQAGADVTTYVDSGPDVAPGQTYTYCVATRGANGIESERACADGKKKGSTDDPFFFDDVTSLTSKLTDPDGGEVLAQFGYDVAADANRVLVLSRQRSEPNGSSSAGAIFEYERGPTGLKEVERIYGPGEQLHSVGLDGSLAFTTSPLTSDPQNSNVGVLYAYQREANQWTQQSSVVGGTLNGAGDNFRFGTDLSVGDDYVLVAQGDRFTRESTTLGHRVFSFERDGKGTLTETGLLQAGGGPYGHPVAVAHEGRYAIVGGDGDDSIGSVYLFERDNSGSWTKTWETTTDGDIGSAVAVSGDYFFAGAPGADTPTTDAGVVYVYRRNGGQLERVQTIIVDRERTFLRGRDGFGASLDAQGDLLAVGAPNGPNGGAAYLFRRDGGRYVPVRKMVPSDEDADKFGGPGLTIGGGTLFVGDHENVGAEVRGAVFRLGLGAAPQNVAASDGAHSNRVALNWADVADNESGYHIYRDGDLLATTGVSENSYADKDALPGVTHRYCVAAFRNDLGVEGSRICDFGRRRPDGAISGRVERRDGSPFDSVEVRLSPSPNKSLLFDGNEGHVLVDGFSLPDDTVSVSFWLRTDDANETTPFSYATSGGGDNTFLINNPSNLGVYVAGQAAGRSGADVSDGQWHHVAATWRSRDGRLELYVDGERRLSTTVAQGETLPGPGVLVFGQEQDVLGGGFQATQALDGQLDEMRVWSTVRTEAQIRARMTQALTGTEEGLYAYWPMDESAGPATADLARDQYAALRDGAYHADEAAPLQSFARTDTDGNYTLNGLSYGEETQYKVTPVYNPHSFSPSTETVTLSLGSPVQNQVDFTDQTSIPVAGAIPYEGTTCAAEEVEVLVDGQKKATTDANGAYKMDVLPGPRTVTPQYETTTEDGGSGLVHAFAPADTTVVVEGRLSSLNFEDVTTNTLQVKAKGGCGFSVGRATLKIRSTNGCYEKTVTTDANGVFTAELPPLEYTVQVVGVEDVPDPSQEVPIEKYFARLGAQAVDLTTGSDSLDMTYRAPIQVAVNGLPSGPSCQNVDVPVVERNQELDLRLTVNEDYGGGNLCPVDSAKITTYDGFAGKSEEPMVGYTDANGELAYHTFGRSPNLASGLVVDGVDRSYQKSLSVVAEAGAKRDETTRWAIVEGRRAREGTQFVTQPVNLPVAVVRDPPGDGSSAFLEKGTTVCNTRSMATETSQSVSSGFVLGAEASTEVGWWGFYADITFRATSGAELTIGTTSNRGNSFTTCATTGERIATSAAPAFVGRPADLFLGAGVNFVFAKTDVLQVDGRDSATCTIDQSQSVAFEPDSISTSYLYTRAQVEEHVIPNLRDLKANAEERTLDYDAAIRQWQNNLYHSDKLAAEAEVRENRTFNGGATYEWTETETESRTTQSSVVMSRSVRGFLEAGTVEPATALYTFEASSTTSVTQGSASETGDQVTHGFTLSDDDGGDSFTVDVKSDPGYGTTVFETRSGVSSCPHEPWPEPMDAFTSFEGDRDEWGSYQGEPVVTPRDKPALRIADGIASKSGVAPDGAAEFQLALINESPNDEGRTYRLQSVQASNPGGAVLRANGEPLFQGQDYAIPAGNTQEVTLSVERGPSQYRYDSLAVVLYPACGSAGSPYADTVAVSVQYEAPSSPIDVFAPTNGFALNAATADDSLDVAFDQFSMDTTDTGRRVAEIGLFYRPAKDLLTGPKSATASEGPARFLPPELQVQSEDSTGGRYLSPAAARRLFAAVDTAGRPADTRAVAKSSDDGEQGTSALEDWALTVVTVPRSELLAYHDCPDEACELDTLTGYATKALFEDTDDIYELAAYTKTEDADGTLTGAYVSEPIRMRVDTERPEVLYAPDPSGEVLALGDDIKLTFDERIDCETIRATGSAETDNVRLRYVEGPNSGTPLPIETSCDGRTIVLKPSLTLLDEAEGRLLQATVQGRNGEDGVARDNSSQPLGVTDLAENPIDVNTATDLEEDVVWQFRVRRSAFAWSPVNPVTESDQGEAAVFETKLTNGTEEAAEYRIEDAAPWLAVSIQQDSLPASGVRTVRFQAADTLSAGTYRDTLRAVDAANGRAAPLFAEVTVKTPPPPDCDPPAAWTQPDSLAYTMPVFARYYRPDGTLSTDTSDVVAALVGGEVRGVARLDSVAQNDYRLQLNTTSNRPAGETVSFKVHDASACRTYPVTQTVPFDRDSVVTRAGGGPIDLEAISPANATTIAVNNGWTWVSFNRSLGADTTLQDVLGPLSPRDGAYVKTQRGFAQRSGGQWFGSLGGLRPGEGYFVRLDQTNTLVAQGTPVDLGNTPVELVTGWNWIGYLPQRPQPLGDALANFSPQAGDLVKGQLGFAVWTDTDGDGTGDRWLGSLETMRPGTGYLLKTGTAATFTYPAAPKAVFVQTDSAADSTARDSLERRPDWTVEPKRYRYNASITARLTVDGEPIADERALLGVFVRDSLRGVAPVERVEGLDDWRAYALVFSNDSAPREMTLKVYNPIRDTVVAADQTITVRPDTVIGGPTDPLVVDVPAVDERSPSGNVPETVALKPNYPNPVDQTTTIPYHLPAPDRVRFEIYDVLGRRVYTTTRTQTAGRHELQVQARQFSSGVYFYRMRAGGVVRTRRFVVVR